MDGLTKNQINDIKGIVAQAGQMALDFWNGLEAMETQAKPDGSPVTEADKALSRFYIEELPKVLGVPVISEEGDLAQGESSTFFLVDPIDGTRYFSEKKRDWVTMVALIQEQRPTFGMIAHPLSGKVYWAQKGAGVFSDEGPLAKPMANPPYTSFSSGFHKKPIGEEIKKYFNLDTILERGSALKFIGVASGEAELYPRKGNTGEWDTAAGQILVEEAGGFLLDLNTGRPMLYGKPGYKNTGFVAGHNCMLERTTQLLKDSEHYFS